MNTFVYRKETNERHGTINKRVSDCLGVIKGITIGSADHQRVTMTIKDTVYEGILLNGNKSTNWNRKNKKQ